MVQINLRYSFISCTEDGFGLVEPNGPNSSLVYPFDFSDRAAVHPRTEWDEYFHIKEFI